MSNGELQVTSSGLWKDFQKDARYQDIISDLLDRKQLLINDLVRGPEPGELPANTDNELRKRINELDYVLALVDTFILDCEQAEKDRKTNISDKETQDESEA